VAVRLHEEKIRLALILSKSGVCFRGTLQEEVVKPTAHQLRAFLHEIYTLGFYNSLAFLTGEPSSVRSRLRHAVTGRFNWPLRARLAKNLSEVIRVHASYSAIISEERSTADSPRRNDGPRKFEVRDLQFCTANGRRFSISRCPSRTLRARPDRSIRLRQIDLPARPQPHDDLIDGTRIPGRFPPRRERHLSPRIDSPTCAAASAWSSRSRTRSPSRSFEKRRLRPTRRRRAQPAVLAEILRTLPAPVGLWRRSEGPPRRFRPSTSPAAAAAAVIARALATDPKCCSWDASSSALDPPSTAHTRT